jgi:hypothetical protein
MNEHINEIEIALRDGLIDELSQATETSVTIIKRLANLITHYEEIIQSWEEQNKDLIITLSESVDQNKQSISQNKELNELLSEALEQRDRARAIAVKLEQECHSCNDTVHHGNEEVYG